MSSKMEMSADEHVIQTLFHLEPMWFSHTENVQIMWCTFEKKCAFACIWVSMMSTHNVALTTVATG